MCFKRCSALICFKGKLNPATLCSRKLSHLFILGRRGEGGRGKEKLTVNYHVSNKQGIKWGPEDLMVGFSSVLPEISTWDLFTSSIALPGALHTTECHFSYPHRVSKLWPPLWPNDGKAFNPASWPTACVCLMAGGINHRVPSSPWSCLCATRAVLRPFHQ